MYQSYWGLGQAPFRGNLDPRFFHQGPTHEEALARLQFLVEEHRTLGLLLGEAGTGKSLILEIFARSLGRVGRQSAKLNLAGLDPYGFLWQLAGQLGIESAIPAGTFALTRAVTDHIAANRYQQRSTILLLDDADTARPEVSDQVVWLAQLDTSRDARLTIVLAAQPERLYKLDARLLELADLRIDLEGWDADDTATFVKQALAKAGRTTPIFSEAALVRLHELTAGIPRRVKQLADLALLAGAGGNLAQIEPATIDSVYQELGVVSADGPLAEFVRR
jgi:type II secretory pathway predicted ATPase ExeA